MAGVSKRAEDASPPFVTGIGGWTNTLRDVTVAGIVAGFVPRRGAETRRGQRCGLVMADRRGARHANPPSAQPAAHLLDRPQ